MLLTFRHCCLDGQGHDGFAFALLPSNARLPCFEMLGLTDEIKSHLCSLASLDAQILEANMEGLAMLSYAVSKNAHVHPQWPLVPG